MSQQTPNDTTPDAAPTPAQRRRDWGWLVELSTPLVISVAVVFGASLIIEKRVEQKLEEALRSRPDIAVVDDIGLVQLAIQKGADRYNPAQVSSVIEQMVGDAGLQDTILVSRSMVMYSPPESRIEVATPQPAVSLKREAGQ